MPAGHRCGYVLVEKGHPLYGVLDDELPVDFRPEVNGGITYAGHKNNDDRWAFGFDFDHYWDIPDDACNEYKMACNPGLKLENLEIINTRLDPDARVATLDMAVEDCERLAECLLEWSGKPYVYTIDDSWYYSDRVPDEIVCKGIRYVKA